MRGAKNQFSIGASVAALSLSNAAIAQDSAQVPQAFGTGASASKPAARTISFTVPLVSDTRAYGDVLIEVVGNGDEVRIQADGLQRELEPILNEDGLSALSQLVEGQEFIPLETLGEAGFDLVFDTGQLQVAIIGIDPQFRSVQPLIPSRESGRRSELDRLVPSRFSSYLNVVANVDHSTDFGTVTPEIFLSGATRIGNIVAEFDGAFTDQFDESFAFARRSTRLVFDDPGTYRRYSAGDLRLESLSILNTPLIGGIGVEKRRRIFDPGLSATRVNGRQIFLDNRSQVEVRVDGQVVETLQLDSGAYDLSSLPIQQGSNNIDLVIRDSFGQEQILNYDFFFETLPLQAGEEEYSIGLGFLADNLGFEPNYSSELALSALYRKAFSENLVAGGALQLAEDVQVIGGELMSVPQFIPGVLEFEAAGSLASGQAGVSLRAGYRYFEEGAIAGSNQFSIDVSYETAGFTNLNNLLPIDFDLFSLTGTYSRAFTQDTIATIGMSYFTGGDFPDDYALFFDLSHRLNDRMLLSGGAEYGRSSDTRSAFGVRIGITVAFGQGARASADYRSRFDSFRANFSNAADNDIGSLGYEVGVSRFGDETRADAQLSYEANRFNSRLDLTSRGNSIGGITDEQRVRLQVGTSIAVAGGQFGIGRPISNSFLLAKPNSTIKDQSVITGRSIRSGEYYARSGPFGSAVQGNLSDYSAQNVQFDAADANNGFDVGDGVVLVEPPYKSGFAVIAGQENYVSIIGKLLDENGPVSIVSGTVVDLETGEVLDNSSFFTNSAGRFGLFGLAPGRSYEVRISGSGRRFVLTVPDDAEPIIRMAPMTLRPDQ